MRTFRSLFLTVCVKILLYAGAGEQKSFGQDVVPILILFVRIFLSSNTGSGNLNNLKGGPYYILQPGSALILFNMICGG